MNNPNNDLFNTNYSFVKNNETFNQKLFDRNFLSSQMAQKPNFNPTYFNKQQDDNKRNAETIFNKRFTEMDVNNQPQGGKMGYVDFTDSKPQIKKKLNSKTDFTGNYKEHIHKTESADNLAYTRNSDRLINNRSFLERKKDKR